MALVLFVFILIRFFKVNILFCRLLITGIFGSWLLMDVEAAFASSAVLTYAIYLTLKSYKSITNMFHFDEDDAVNFDDLLDATQTLIPSYVGKPGVLRRVASSGNGVETV